MEPRACNSYDFIRFCAASAVLYSHHFALAGMAEPGVPLYGEDFGKLAVEVFFCLSGFLICRSLMKSNDWASFVGARCLRIFPNLLFSLVVTTAVTFMWYHNFPNMASHLKYVVRNCFMFVRGVDYVIPGVFEDAKSHAVNGPLWSLPAELWLYVLLFFCFTFGGRRASAVTVVCLLVLSTAWTFAPYYADIHLHPFDSEQFARLGTFFLSGSVVALYWQSLGRHPILVGVISLLGLVEYRNMVVDNSIVPALALAGAVVGLGSHRLMAWFSKGGDASYGMYIFA